MSLVQGIKVAVFRRVDIEYDCQGVDIGGWPTFDGRTHARCGKHARVTVAHAQKEPVAQSLVDLLEPKLML